MRLLLIPLTALIILVLAFLFLHFYHAETPVVALAPAIEAQAQAENEQRQFIAVTNENVQDVIRTLHRAPNYTQVIAQTHYWQGGSNTRITEVFATPAAVRLRTQTDLQVIITPNYHHSWIGASAQITRPITEEMGVGFARLLDELKGIESYETVLSLAAEQIKQAGYTNLLVDEMWHPVIYVHVQNSMFGYLDIYHICTQSGLLLQLETWDGDTLVYRLETLHLLLSLMEEDVFTLPNGTHVLDLE